MNAQLAGTASFALGAGAATFFSPCAYALLPGYVGYYAAAVDDGGVPIADAAVRGLAAATGALLAFGVLSGIALAAAEAVERLLPVVEPLVGVALVALGGVVLSGRSLGAHVSLPERRTSVLGFALFGGLYALAATACVLPLFLAVAVQSMTFGTAGAAAVLASYAGSFAGLMLAVTVATAVGHRVGAGAVAGGVDRFTTVAGALLVVAGVGQVAYALGVV
ncbi:cytochrome c biogenesis CcdA family protein [Halorubrum sp. CSM-61]|uniref:cytochrome c biogenesis CcdA family protein n=1 Tax=Halorubrum sp. CSM-61 TaxID=2485838 RepID=UPI000F4BD08B|nr:cytochrome C biogenesis protein [Halorubrum sp. CSM-61]